MKNLIFKILFLVSLMFVFNLKMSAEELYEKKYYDENNTLIFRVYENEDKLLFESSLELNGFYTIESEIYYLNKDTHEVYRYLLTVNKKTYYFDEHGILKKGFVTHENKTYYFDKNGCMLKGWQTISKNKYYFNTDGTMTIGFKTIKKKLYYFDTYGIKRTGLVKYSNKYYYVYDGYILKKSWKKIGKYKYYFNSKGIALVGFHKIGSSTYYFNSSARMLKGFQTISGNVYHFSSTGRMTTGWKKLSHKWYHFNSKGVMAIGFKTINKKIYYFDSKGIQRLGLIKYNNNYYYMYEGKMVKNKWKTVNKSVYYFGSDGKAYIGINKISGKYYYFNNYGKMERGWKTIDGSIYYFGTKWYAAIGKNTINKIAYNFESNGKLVSGFTVIEDKTYYIDANGKKVTDWNYIEGKKYYFNIYGEMQQANAKKVMDISAWQGEIDWETVKEKSDVDGVIIRIGYTGSESLSKNEDKRFERNIKYVKKYNYPFGIYYYGNAKNILEVTEEASKVVEILKKYNVKPTYPVFYDAEIASITKEEYEVVIPTFISILESSGYTSGVYGNLNAFLSGYLNSNLIKNNNIWVAQYFTTCQYTGNYVGWQYTSKGSVPGISGNVDLNVWK